MNTILQDSAFFGVTVSLLAYGAGNFLKRRFRLSIFNPLLISIAATMLLLRGGHIDYPTYKAGASILSWLLTPATVCLAIPLYEKMDLLKQNWKALVAGIGAGVLTSLICVFTMALIFHLNHTEYVTLLPKSITTAIGIGVSEELGGYVTITVAVIIITGILGNMIAEAVCRILRIHHPIAKGVAIGTASHAIGTVKAMELGKVEGSVSSLSIVVAGLLTVIGASFVQNFI